MPSLTILDSVKGVFTSYNFGNVVAGASTIDKLLFVSSTGVDTASGAVFGVKAITGNDGYSFGYVALGQPFDNSGGGISGSAVSGSGTISGSLSGSMLYRVSVIDAFGYESALSSGVTYTPAMASGTNTYAHYVSWTAISGASTYGLYLSLDSGATFKQVTTTANLTYANTSGTAGSTDPAASGSYAYRPSGTWTSSTGTVSLGNMAPGAISATFLRETVPSGTTSAANPRQHYVYTRYTV